VSAALERLEQIIDGAGVAPRIEALLPVGVRPRQLSVHTMLLAMLLVAADNRPARLRKVHEALVKLPDAERTRLGIIAQTQPPTTSREAGAGSWDSPQARRSPPPSSSPPTYASPTPSPPAKPKISGA
jgi:hypothetical protein